MPRHEPVEPVEEPRQPERAEDTPERSGKPDLGQEHQAPAVIARDRGTIAEHEPPALAALVLGYPSEQSGGFLVGERQQRQLVPSVERGDDPRRPSAELSAAGIKEDRARQVTRARYARAHVVRFTDVIVDVIVT